MHQVPHANPIGAERALHTHFPIEDCGYLHSYPPTSTKIMPGKREGSASIPIARQSMRKTASEYQMAQDEAEADFKDFVFFSRVVDGISRQNSLLQDGSYLKSTNQTLLDNIVRSRHALDETQVESDDDECHNHYYYPSKQRMHHDLKIVTPTKNEYTLETVPPYPHHNDDVGNDYEDEGVFDFEL